MEFKTRNLRIYSSSDSEIDPVNDSSKFVCLLQRSETYLLNENSKNDTVPQHAGTDHQLTSTSPKNLSRKEDSSGEDNIPLTQLSTKSPFQKFKPTPDYGDIKTRPQRKALNYMGQRVTKDLFNKKHMYKQHRKEKEFSVECTENKKSGNNSKGKKNESWYCHACLEEKVADMRACKDCLKWYHKDCVGITKDDSEEFLCPDCDKN